MNEKYIQTSITGRSLHHLKEFVTRCFQEVTLTTAMVRIDRFKLLVPWIKMNSESSLLFLLMKRVDDPLGDHGGVAACRVVDHVVDLDLFNPDVWQNDIPTIKFRDLTCCQAPLA
jgi:hypothetical protein